MNELTTPDMDWRMYALPAHATPTLTKTVFSRCHKYAGGWKPELGSPLFGTKVSAQDVGRGTKYHWTGSGCQWVVGRWAFQARERTVEGDEFIRLTEEDKCGCCKFHFSEA